MHGIVLQHDLQTGQRCESLPIVGVPADVSVELAVCCLLLGDSEKAEDVLGLAPGSSVQQADPAVRSFVLVSASNHATLTPMRLDAVWVYTVLGFNAAVTVKRFAKGLEKGFTTTTKGSDHCQGD